MLSSSRPNVHLCYVTVNIIIKTIKKMSGQILIIFKNKSVMFIRMNKKIKYIFYFVYTYEQNIWQDLTNLPKNKVCNVHT